MKIKMHIFSILALVLISGVLQVLPLEIRVKVSSSTTTTPKLTEVKFLISPVMVMTEK